MSTLRAVIWSLEMHVTRLRTLFFCHCGRKTYKSFCVGCAIDGTRDYLLLGLAKFSGSFQCKCEEMDIVASGLSSYCPLVCHCLVLVR